MAPGLHGVKGPLRASTPPRLRSGSRSAVGRRRRWPDHHRRTILDATGLLTLPLGMLEHVRLAAEAEGVTVSEWVRQAVADALTQREHGDEDKTTIARELERLARQLRRSA